MCRVMWLLLFCNELLASGQSASQDRITLCYDHWPPATIHASVREPRHGFMVDMARDIFLQANYAVTLREVPYARGLHDVVAGGCDVMLLMPKLPDRGLRYPRLPAMYSRNGFFVPAHSQWQYRGLASLARLRIGNIIGYDYSSISPAFAAFIAQPAAGASIITKSGTQALPQLLSLLALGRLDLMVEDEQVARYLLRRQGLANQVKQVGAFPVSLALYPGFSSRYPGVGKLVALWDLAMQPSQISGRLIQRMADY